MNRFHRLLLQLPSALLLVLLSTSVHSIQAGNESSAQSAKSMYEKGMLLIQTYSGIGENYSEAQQIAGQIYTEDPDSPYSYLLMGKLYQIRLNSNDQNTAQEINRLIDKAIALDPGISDAYVLRSRVTLKMGDVQSAKTLAEQALSINKANGDAMFTMAEISEREGRFKEAENWYLKALDAYPDPGRQSNVHYWLGNMLLLNTPDFQRAKEHRKLAVDLSPNAPWKLLNYAVFLNNYTKDYEAAADYASRALAIKDFPAARTALGIAKYGSWAEAYLEGEANVDELNQILMETGMTSVEAHKYDTRYESKLRISEALVKSGQIKAETRSFSGPGFSVDNPYPTKTKEQFIEQWQAAISESDRQQRSRLISNVTREWAYSDPISALNAIDELPNLSERQRHRSIVIDHASRRQPEVVLGLVNELTNQNELRTLLTGAFSSLAAQNPENALDLALELTTVEKQKHAVNTVFRVWAQTDPRDAARAYAELPNRGRFPDASMYIVSNYVLLDTDEAVSWAISVDGQGGALWNQTVRRIASENPEAAFKIISEIPDSMDQIQAVESVMGSISATNPQLAIQYAGLLPDGDIKSKTITRAALNWARQDIHAVFEWIPTQSESIQTKVMMELGGIAGRSDLDSTLAFPLDEVPESALASWVRIILPVSARNNPQSTYQWLQQVNSNPEYDHWISQLAGYWAEQDPYAALDLVEQIVDEKWRQRAYSQVIGSWARSDGVSASNWVENQPPGSQKLDLIFSVAYSWHRAHASAARNWVMSLADPEERDRGIMGMMNAVFPDTDLAEEYINLLTSSDNRNDSLGSLLFQMSAQDPYAAQTYLDSISVPDELRNSVQEEINRIIEFHQNSR